MNDGDLPWKHLFCVCKAARWVKKKSRLFYVIFRASDDDDGDEDDDIPQFCCLMSQFLHPKGSFSEVSCHIVSPILVVKGEKSLIITLCPPAWCQITQSHPNGICM